MHWVVLFTVIIPGYIGYGLYWVARQCFYAIWWCIKSVYHWMFVWEDRGPHS